MRKEASCVAAVQPLLEATGEAPQTTSQKILIAEDSDPQSNTNAERRHVNYTKLQGKNKSGHKANPSPDSTDNDRRPFESTKTILWSRTVQSPSKVVVQKHEKKGEEEKHPPKQLFRTPSWA